MAVSTFKKLNFKPESDFFYINKKKGKITFGISAIEFIDKDTKQFVIYLPNLDITSYGNTKEKAEQMLKECVDDYCTYLIRLSLVRITTELRKLGWKHDLIHTKEFSKSSIDINGNLKGFNAQDDKVTITKLEAA